MKRLAVRSSVLAVAAVAALATGCATSNPDTISRADAQRMSTVVDAVVLSSRPVTVDGSQSGIGSATGAIVGGVAGSGVGGSRDGIVAGVIGAVVGGVIGNAVERAGTREEAVELMLQLKNGERRAVVQAKGSETFNPGDAVIIVTTGGKVRVSKAPPVQPGAPAQPVAGTRT